MKMLCDLKEIPEEFLEKFKQKLKTTTRRQGDCLIWMGGLAGHSRRQGGTVLMRDETRAWNRRFLGVGRLAYILAHGSIPPDKMVTSICKHRTCVEISHLVIKSSRKP